MSSYAKNLHSSRQPKINDYFQPKETLSKSQRTLLQSRHHSFILDLPNELFLLILDHLRWEDEYYDIIRQLYLVCKRFCHLFAPFVFQSFRVFEQFDKIQYFTRSRVIWNSVSSPAIRARVKYLEVHYPVVGHEVLIPRCAHLLCAIIKMRNITTLKLHLVLVNNEAVAALGLLPHLTSLAYDNFLTFSAFPSHVFANYFDDDVLPPSPWDTPCSLRFLTVMSYVHDDHSMSIIVRILRGSAKTLASVVIGFLNPTARLPTEELCSLQFPSLSHLGLHHVEYDRDFFDHFLSSSCERLTDINIITRNPEIEDEDHWDYLCEGPDLVFLSDLPGLEDLPKERVYRPMRAFAMNMRLDSSRRLTGNNISLFSADWNHLPIVLERHPSLRSLSMWDSGYPDLRILEEPFASSKLETLRFAVGNHMPSMSNPADMPMVYCDTEEPNSCCDCVACLSNVFTEDGRLKLQDEWEITRWHEYELLVESIVAILPSLTTVEWYFGRAFDSFDPIALPFWRWNIDRSHGSSRPQLKRQLFNWRPTHPFSPLKGWSMTLGMTPDLASESEVREAAEVHIEAIAWREHFDPVDRGLMVNVMHMQVWGWGQDQYMSQ